MSEPEVWLRGPVAGFPEELQPVAHALLQAREDLNRLVPGLAPARLRARPGSAASIEYHLRHLAGSIDRLCTYARGEALSDAQTVALRTELYPEDEPGTDALLAAAVAAIDAALEQVRTTPVASLGAPREVGRGRLPSNVRGLLFHVAEHTTRHVGQISTLLRVTLR